MERAGHLPRRFALVPLAIGALLLLPVGVIKAAPGERLLYEGGGVYTDNRAPVEWLADQSLLDYAAGRR